MAKRKAGPVPREASRATGRAPRPRRRLPWRRWWRVLTLNRVWTVISLLVVLVMILSLIAPAFTGGR
ncbi:MAG: hypothetical protein FJ029_02585 [Actinobacteria bacterium]|nr:hypothetical protein [Actinomycetota bacterium]